jgi:hypothetical protein
MTHANSRARVVQPATAIIEGAELTRIGELAYHNRAFLLKHLFGGAAGVFSGLSATATGASRVITVGAGDGVNGNGYPIVVPAALPPGGNAPSVTLAAGHATWPRIDIVYLQATEIDGDSASTPTKISRTAAVTNLPLAHSKLQHFTIGVAQGTPAGSPTVPAIPAGALAVCRVAVAAGATTISNGNLTDVRYLLPSIRPPGPPAFIFEAVGNLAAMIGYDMGAQPAVGSFPIGGIVLLCPKSAASGTITVDLLKASAGGSPSTLYTSNPKPTITCNGGYAVATYSSPNLPNTTSLAAGEILIPRIVNAPNGCQGLKVMVY